MTGRRTYGSGSIFRDAKGVWHFRKDIGRDPATGRRRTIEARGRTRADARARFNAKVAELERTGLLPGGKSPELADYTERWLADYRTRVKPTTYRTREGRLKACNEVIGQVRLKDLTPEHIRRCMRVLGERLAPSTLKDHYVSLKMVLDQAELEGLIPVDPCRRVKPPRVERRVVDVLGPKQPRRMIEAASSMPLARRGARPAEEDLEMWALLFEVAFETGMREGERYAIMPFELELRDGQPGIHVRQQIQRYGRPGEVEIPNWLEATHLSGTLWLTTPKTPAAERFVPVSGSLWERLWKRIRDNGIGSRELVFTSARGNPVCSSTERYQWCKALKAAGLPQVKIHSARHWMATMAARANMPDDARIAVMGHTSMQMTMRYTHRDAASLGQLMAAAIPDLGGGEIVEAEVMNGD
ncbi:tyrosine recombinase XerC [uncultured Bifidobacterium sp.]|uniref:site-specific integrase n=1 Tax=uncultured Bifidobacterium sp. TaxID=165187 RepID=UPI00258AF476|nr:tyrosine-type recombinase/integrase [uncultured Bifidobacterium sp.]